MCNLFKNFRRKIVNGNETHLQFSHKKLSTNYCYELMWVESVHYRNLSFSFHFIYIFLENTVVKRNVRRIEKFHWMEKNFFISPPSLLHISHVFSVLLIFTHNEKKRKVFSSLLCCKCYVWRKKLLLSSVFHGKCMWWCQETCNKQSFLSFFDANSFFML